MTEFSGEAEEGSALKEFVDAKRKARLAKQNAATEQSAAKKDINAAGRSVLACFAELLKKEDLSPEDISPSLLLRRALFCATKDEDAASLAYLKFVADMIALKATLKKQPGGKAGSVLERSKIAQLLDHGDPLSE